MFSGRIPEDRRPNRLSLAADRARARGAIDLTTSNPTAVGIAYPPALLDALAHPDAARYAPAPFGLEDARAAVADTYARRGLDLHADRIVLTASTSEAYSLLFKLLCDPGDEVLTPVPSYPLFDHLTRLDAVAQRRYALQHYGSWIVDAADVDRLWTDRTRALLVVSPNNPTGSLVSDEDA